MGSLYEPVRYATPQEGLPNDIGNESSGPAEITIFHPEAYEAMDGPDNRNTRSDWYDLLYPRISSIFTRDRQLHHERRKMWEQALSRKGLVNPMAHNMLSTNTVVQHWPSIIGGWWKRYEHCKA